MYQFSVYWLFVLLLIIDFSECSICNYIYEMNTTRAYPTNVCMKLGSISYIKYQCIKSYNYSSNYTIIMQSFESDKCASDTFIQNLDLNDWIKTYNFEHNTSIGITYNCGGIDNCFIEYMDTCSAETENNNRFYPLQQCLNNYNKSISFKYECDPSLQTLSYYKYDGIDCIESDYNIKESVIDIESNSCIEYVQCKSTPYPTISPSLSPSPSPTGIPSQSPTYYIPFRNKSLDAIIDILRNGSYDNSSAKCKLSVLIFTVFIITINILFV